MTGIWTPFGQKHWDPRVGETYVAKRHAEGCAGDNGRCKLEPERGPRLVVPPTPFDPALEPRRVMTTLRYCRRHAGAVTAADLLTRIRGLKGQIEAVAKQRWPHGHVPDFDRARLDWMLLGTPEYRAFLVELEQGRRAAHGVPIL